MSTPTGAPHWSDVAVMISLQQNLQNKSISDKREEKFIRHSLHYLRSTSRQEPRIDWWTISPVDVDFGELLGSGGLSVNTLHMVEDLTSREIIAVKFIKELGK